MQVKKEECAEALYLMSMYSVGILQRHTPRQRAERKKITREGKAKINAMHRKYALMLLVNANFEPGRDLFVYLGWAHEPSDAEDRAAMRNFHRRMTAFYQKKGIPYKYVDVPEEHTRDGEPCRKHHHLILSGAGRRMLGKIIECWGCGSVDVRTLRELTDNFEDTCRYLLKEQKGKGKRAYNCSQNLRRPPDPLRRKVPDAESGVVPPGVKVIRHDMRDTVCGRYEILVGKIIDQNAFDRYWQRAKTDKRSYDARSFWRSQSAKKIHREHGGGVSARRRAGGMLKS